MKITGFTPAVDKITQESDVLTSIVYGRIWRFAQMDQKKCVASYQTIGEHLNISRKTVQRRVEWLLENGYIKDVPGDPGGTRHFLPLLDITTTLYMGVTESPTPRSESPTPQVRESYKESIKKESKKESKEDEEESENIFKLYTSNIGIITPMMGEKLKDAETEYPQEWIKDAFEIAVDNNARKWSYVQAVLEGWKSNGRDWSPVKTQEKPEYLTTEERVQKVMKELDIDEL